MPEKDPYGAQAVREWTEYFERLTAASPLFFEVVAAPPWTSSPPRTRLQRRRSWQDTEECCRRSARQGLSALKETIKSSLALLPLRRSTIYSSSSVQRETMPDDD
ncbi:hypothetical protein DL546_008068 [Coniochaeta pulveracea]|uniref:Uncharacterized protein n=1 Tax=Coniochaeta pulveracea TaxID=177199 RepID=A0A420YBG0_9PEZI|nr:hypothetical protein DL546_008068 [Coniochaeta pulveracea]